MKKGVSDPPRRFDGSEKRSGHSGPGPKPAPKRAVNISVDAEILKVAKEMNINLSQAFEELLRKLTQEERVRRFQDEHRQSIESYNRFIEKNGLFGARYRKW